MSEPQEPQAEKPAEPSNAASSNAESIEQKAPAADPAATHVVAELKYSSPLISCRFDPTGRFIFAGAQDSAIVRWTLEDTAQAILVGHESWVRSMAFDPTGNVLWTGDYTGRLIRWPAAAESPAPEQSIEAHQGFLRAVAVSRDGQLVATSGNDNMVRLWTAAEGTLVSELAGHESHVYNLAFHPEGQFLVSADLKGVLKQWDIASGEEIRQFDASKIYKYDSGFRADIGGVRGMAFSADGRYLAASGTTKVTNAFAGVGNPAVVLLDWESGKEIQLLVAKETFNGVCWGVAFHPDGFIVGASGGGGGGFLLFWKPDEPVAFHRFKLPNTVRDMALHPDGLRVAVAHYDGHLRLYQMTPKAEGQRK